MPSLPWKRTWIAWSSHAAAVHIPIADLRARLDRGIHELLLAIPNPSDLYLRPTILSKLEVTR